MIRDEVFEYVKDLVSEPIDSIYLWNDDDDKYYEKIINRLVQLRDKRINDWVWNALRIREDEYSIEKSSLEPEAQEFVKEFIDEKTKWYSNLSYISKDGTTQILKGTNEKIIGDRVVLIPCQTKESCDLFLSHVRNDGDYKIYFVPSDSSIILEKGLRIDAKLPNSFYVCLKNSGEEIGIVSLYDHNLNHNKILRVADAHYYIYKEFRHHGYALEAMKLLINAFFNSKLKQNVSTDKHYIFVEKHCEPLCIKLSCNKDNAASNGLALKLGFEFEGTNHYYKFMDGIPQDENNYYLDINSYKSHIGGRKK